MKIPITEYENVALISLSSWENKLNLGFGPGRVTLDDEDPQNAWALPELAKLRGVSVDQLRPVA